MEDMRALANNAVEMGEDFGLLLDFTPESIEFLEKLAQVMYHSHNRFLPLPENILCGAAYTLGAYLGETMLRSGLADLGFSWKENEEGQVMVGRDDEWLGPVGKVYKRITEGPYHNLVDFYDVCVGLIGGWVDLDDPRLHNVSEVE